MTTQPIRLGLPAWDEQLAPDDQRVSVLIADHDGLARRMMQTTLQDAAGVVMVIAARDACETLELARYYGPTVLILDTALPPAGGVELIGKVLGVVSEVRILTVSATDDDQAALAALRAGAVGHIDKDVDPDTLVRLVLRAAEGEAIVPRRLTMPLLGLVQELPDAGWRPLHSRLTTREWQIVQLLADGASTQRIAERLVLEQSTVYSHVKSVLRKLGVHSRREAVAAAERLRREEALARKAPNLVRVGPPVSLAPGGSSSGDRPLDRQRAREASASRTIPITLSSIGRTE
jgi:two-component system, NarL family, nitrate/nitrite response regulator NarL